MKGNRDVAAGSNPLAQFEIQRWIPIEVSSIDMSFTNSAAFMVAAVVATSALMILSVRKRAAVPGRWQLLAELSYSFIAQMVSDTVGKEGRPYFPFVFTLFMFVLFGNFLGMIPYSFTFTSHLAVTFGMAMIIFLAVTVIAAVKHRMGFFRMFLPPGVPIAMAPLLIPIEIISYLSRPVSLSVRLFANMMAGHTLLKVVAGFVVPMGVAFGWIPLIGLIPITALELLIAFLQAYIFTILTCIYINDAIHMH
jgi:F-type H+-transporting ATPase subunit a